ncbi:hypothetical protein EDB83DRAFT_2528585 [Lactarius deliciosus]|nr:hypothetical protein EDB83DRAFT_2528585 [Lactarius deliciosus]
MSSKARRPDIAHHYGLAHVLSLDPARWLCSTRQPRPVPNPSTIFDFDPLRKLDAVLLVQVHSFFALFHIFQVALDDPECLPARARGHHRGI